MKICTRKNLTQWVIPTAKTEKGKKRNRKSEESVGDNFDSPNLITKTALGPVVSLFSGEAKVCGKRKRSEISVTSENKPVMEWTDNDTKFLKKILLSLAEIDLDWAHDGRQWRAVFWDRVAGDYNHLVLNHSWNRQNLGLNGHTNSQIAIKACELEAEFVSVRESNGYNTEFEPLFSNSTIYLPRKTTTSQTQSMSSGVGKRSRSDYETGASSRDNNGGMVAKFINTVRDEGLICKKEYHALMKNKNFLEGSWPGMIEDQQYSKEYIVKRMLEGLEE